MNLVRLRVGEVEAVEDRGVGAGGVVQAARVCLGLRVHKVLEPRPGLSRQLHVEVLPCDGGHLV
ncbi:MAG: hypothetical protein ACK559_25555, partial [bacterium]